MCYKTGLMDKEPVFFIESEKSNCPQYFKEPYEIWAVKKYITQIVLNLEIAPRVLIND